MDSILSRANDAWPFLVVLGVLVFIHEMGHYLAARWRGVHVEAFSIGFGRALVSWVDRQGTVWKLAWIPLGGYVKLHGQEQPEDVTDAVRAGWIRGKTFHEKSVLSRAIVVAAGPIANFLLAAVLFAGLFMFNGRAVTTPVVNDVVVMSPAERAGLRPGDRIDNVDGVVIGRFEDVVAAVTMRPPAAFSSFTDMAYKLRWFMMSAVSWILGIPFFSINFLYNSGARRLTFRPPGSTPS